MLKLDKSGGSKKSAIPRPFSRKDAAAAKKRAARKVADEKKQAAADKKQAAKDAAAAKKAAKKQAVLDKKQAAQDKVAARKQAAQDKKQAAQDKVAARKQAALDKKQAGKNKVSARKAAKCQAAAAKQQAEADKKQAALAKKQAAKDAAAAKKAAKAEATAAKRAGRGHKARRRNKGDRKGKDTAPAATPAAVSTAVQSPVPDTVPDTVPGTVSGTVPPPPATTTPAEPALTTQPFAPGQPAPQQVASPTAAHPPLEFSTGSSTAPPLELTREPMPAPVGKKESRRQTAAAKKAARAEAAAARKQARQEKRDAKAVARASSGAVEKRSDDRTAGGDRSLFVSLWKRLTRRSRADQPAPRRADRAAADAAPTESRFALLKSLVTGKGDAAKEATQAGPAATAIADHAISFDDPAYLTSDVHSVATVGAKRFGGYLAGVVAAFFVVFFAWASFATLDEITRGDGKVVPTGQNKVVQHLEGGIVAAILVREGQSVATGQVLMRIESTVSDSALREKLAKYHALLARAARLRAEATGADTITFPAEVTQSAPKEAAEQRRLFASRKKRQASELKILEQQVSQRKQQLEETRSNVATLTRRVGSLGQELRETRSDYNRGIVSRSELAQIRREYTKAAGQLQSERIAVRRATAALNEVVAKVRDKKAVFTAEARRELAEAESEAKSLEPSIRAGKGTVARTELRAPVRGVIKQIGVATIGAVIKPGQALVEIVPSDDTLLIEARIKPQDRAFLRPNQPATVKISAYDFSIFGGLEGRVIAISADAIEDEKRQGETYYRIRVRTDKNYLFYQGRRLPIIPGMTASVDIKTGKKTVLDYLLEPITNVLEESLTER